MTFSIFLLGFRPISRGEMAVSFRKGSCIDTFFEASDLSRILLCPHEQRHWFVIRPHQSRFPWNKFPVNYTTTFWGKHPFLWPRFVSHPNPRSVYDMVRFLAIYFLQHSTLVELKNGMPRKWTIPSLCHFNPRSLWEGEYTLRHFPWKECHIRLTLSTSQREVKIILEGNSVSASGKKKNANHLFKTRSCLSFRFIIRFYVLPQTRSICDP